MCISDIDTVVGTERFYIAETNNQVVQLSESFFIH